MIKTSKTFKNTGEPFHLDKEYLKKTIANVLNDEKPSTFSLRLVTR